MIVREVMRSPAVVCEAQRPIAEVARMMAARDVAAVVVLGAVGELAGLVTDRDLAVRGVGRYHQGDAPVEQVMTRDVATVNVHTPVRLAVAIMRERGVRRLPVTDDTGHVVGMVTFDALAPHLGHGADPFAGTPSAA